jgi:protein-S-isoprenylcysteine O-methyltransferase Ste14
MFHLNDHFYFPMLYGWIGIAIILFPFLLHITAPYGKHASGRWGAMIPNRTGWIIMELPSLLIFSLFFLTGSNEKNPVTWILFIFWTVHYLNRSVVFPVRTHTKGKKIPLLIVMLAISFNFFNAFFNGHYLAYYQFSYSLDWITDLRFILGGILFIAGMIMNITSDNKLIKLRKQESKGYSLPSGGLFEYVSCPNFFGEIVEWTGFALMAWNPAALSFAVWTFVNLFPRALDHHRWYKSNFENYPLKRKALIPFLI